MYFINYGLIEPAIIPDPCAYHVRNTSWLFDLFYKIDSNDGYHPTPGLFNHIITLVTGVGFGILVGKWLEKIARR